MRKARNFFALLFFSASLLFAVYQLLSYRQFAFEAAWLYSKEMLGVAGPNDHLKHGAICNSLNKYRCSVRYFRQLVAADPADKMNLSNLAINLSLLSRFEESLPYFKAYFASGGLGREAMYWYGRALAAVGQNEESLPWFYQAVSADINNRQAFKELIAELDRQNKLTEIKSVVAAYATLAPNVVEESWWRNYQFFLNSKTADRHPASTTDVENNSSAKMRIPALDRRNFYVPVHNRAGQELIIEFSETAKQNRVNKLHIDIFKDNKIYIGPFEVRNVQFTVCEDCTTTMNTQILTQLNGYLDERGAVPYLVFGGGDNDN